MRLRNPFERIAVACVLMLITAAACTSVSEPATTSLEYCAAYEPVYLTDAQRETLVGAPLWAIDDNNSVYLEFCLNG